ncbi:Ger(x)C family spore germination protein [Paenibacillus sp. BAC0078]
MRAKIIVCMVVCLGLSVILTGCWNSRELNDLAIVSGIGIDKAPGSDRYQVSFQVVVPSASNSSQGAGSGQASITIYSSTDSTIYGALRRTSKRATRKLFFAHTQLLVLGESVAKSGINEIFDIFERSHELRLNTTVLISRDTDAASVLKVLLAQESVPSIGLVKKSDNTAKVWGENQKINVFEAINDITGNGGMTISGVRIIGSVEDGKKKTNLDQSEVQAAILMSGQAVFKKGKLIGWIEGSEARGAGWIVNKLLETNLNIDTSDMKDAVAVNVLFSKTKVKVEIVKGLPVFHVLVTEEGNIFETKTFVDLSKKAEIKKLEAAMEKQTRDEIQQAVQAAQKMKCDYLNFGNELKRVSPAVWATVEKDWEQLFAKGTLDLKIKAYIRGTGMRLAPFSSP